MRMNLFEPNVNKFIGLCLSNGGDVVDLYIPEDSSGWPGFCNPSIYNDNGKLRCILRNVNFIMHCSKKDDKYWSSWGPLHYINRDNDNRQLRTRNFLLELDDDMNIESYNLIDDSSFERNILWEFEGEEDMRLFRWGNKLYGCGVVREDNIEGTGRMVLTELDENGKEVNRNKIESSEVSLGYCEKNWIPVIDRPGYFVRFANPTTIVKYEDESLTTIVEKPIYDSDLLTGKDVRGSSQVIRIGDYYVAIVHMCNLKTNELGKKYARYIHQFILWDLDWNIVKVSQTFSFDDNLIEFCNGMCEKDGNIYISFAVQDNSAHLLKVSTSFIERFINGEYEISGIDNTNTNKLLTHWCNDSGMVYYIDAIRAYTQGFKAMAYHLYQRALSYDDIKSDIRYECLFYMARIIADFGGRDSCEQSMWYRCINEDPKRVEGYAALAIYYWYRGKYNEAYHFIKEAYNRLDSVGDLIFYNKENIKEYYLYIMLHTEDCKLAMEVIKNHSEEYPGLNEYIDNNFKDIEELI